MSEDTRCPPLILSAAAATEHTKWAAERVVISARWASVFFARSAPQRAATCARHTTYRPDGTRRRRCHLRRPGTHEFMADPYWTDGTGRRLPPKPCPKCGANVGPMPLRVEHLRHLGWEPDAVQTYQSWCGHTQEIIPFPRADGWVLFIHVIGEAR